MHMADIEEVNAEAIHWAVSPLRSTPQFFESAALAAEWAEENRGEVVHARQIDPGVRTFAAAMLAAINDCADEFAAAPFPARHFDPRGELMPTTFPTCVGCGRAVARPAVPEDVSREENEPTPVHFADGSPMCGVWEGVRGFREQCPDCWGWVGVNCTCEVEV